MQVRTAQPKDAEVLHALIVALATYEREPDAVEATPASLRAQLAAPTPPFECLLAEHEGTVVGFALFFPTYSTWRGKPGMWLEDFFVLPDQRRLGAGRALFDRLVAIAKERGYGRLELTALDWNELAHGFYTRRGLTRMDDWTRWRLDLD